MTKYVLNSGALKKYPEKGQAFLAEIVKGLGPNPKMLICLFAQAREDWEDKIGGYKDLMGNAPQGVSVSFELAFPDKFEEQIKRSDIVYIHGGDDDLLEYRFSKFDLPKIWEGKVVATSSAGSNLVVKQYWTCDWRVCREGRGVVPIKFIPHFDSDFGATDPRGPINWQQAYEELKNYGDKSLPIHALEEGDFIVINQ